MKGECELSHPVTKIGEKLMDLERRARERQPADLAGSVMSGGYLFPCRIRDISLDGAQLEFEHPIFVDTTMRLSVENHDIDTEIAVVWRRGSSVGVRFLGD